MLLPLTVCHGALLLEHHEKLFIGGQGLLCVLHILLGLRVFLISICELLCLAIYLSLASSDLLLLGCLEVLVCLLVGHLLLLRVAQVALEGLLHLLQDAKDGARLWCVGLLEGWLSIEVVGRGLDKCRDGLALGVSKNSSEHGRVLLHDILD